MVRNHANHVFTMKCLTAFFLILFYCSVARAQAVVQTKYCPNSGVTTAGDGAVVNGVYKCPLPNKTLSNNLIVVHLFFAPTGTTPTVAVSDSASNSYTLAVTNTTANSNHQSIYYLAGAGSGITYVKVSFTGGSDFTNDVNVIVEEWSGVATSSPLDVAHCNSGASTTITAGSMTIGTANDLVVQHVFSDPANGNTGASSETSFTVGAQPGITWLFNATDLNDGSAVQSGVYDTTGAFNATFSQGTSRAFASCAAAFKASGGSGTVPSGNRIIATIDAQILSNATSPVTLQVPLSGNLFVVSSLDVQYIVTGIASTPSCTWSKTGTVHTDTNGLNATSIWYAAGCSGANTMTLSISFTGMPFGTGNFGDTYLVYDVTGPNPWSFDRDSGGQNGNQTSTVSSLTTCSGCDTPSTSTGVAFANFGQDFCTAAGVTAPGGGVIDSATYTGNNINGPENVDQNNGWMHLFYNSSPGTLSVTWSEACGGSPEGFWAGRLAAFKSTSSVTQPPTQLTAAPH